MPPSRLPPHLSAAGLLDSTLTQEPCLPWGQPLEGGLQRDRPTAHGPPPSPASTALALRPPPLPRGTRGSHIRHAWDPTKSVAQNLAEMGLAEDPNKAVPIPRKKGWGTLEVLLASLPCFMVSVLCLEMEYEASLPEKKSNTLSRDLIDYVRYMIQNHGENYKVCTGCPRARSTWSDSLLAFADFPVGSRSWSGATCCFLPREQPSCPQPGRAGWGPLPCQGAGGQCRVISLFY
uniref:Nucleolar protein 16 n=1 Tax=Bubo bubo TaxID=30461 RepID=A0A8C0ERG0_BUBBB